MQVRLTMWALNLPGRARDLATRIREEQGQGMTEYAVLLAFVAAIALVAFTAGGGLATAIEGAVTSAISAI
jgi:Flp pilus assembly pilin Flp